MLTRRRFVLLPPTLTLSAMAGGLSSSACGGSTGQMPVSLRHPLAGDVAPDFRAKNALTSEIINVPGSPDTTLVTVVDFWASWCEACVVAMPHLEHLYRKYRDRGVLVVGISVDEDSHAAMGTVMEVQTTFPIILDPHSRLQGAFAVSKIPTTFVIDRNGLVRWVGRDPSTLERAVDRLVAITKW
ncbi:MAG: TlpA family protein disulfide reductase [Polyangiaceae bacterium]|nr:TlpA family protein disulfide reductase [Polyangiaceae bacterium]